MRNMRNLVNYCVPLIRGSISWPFHDIASPNLVGRCYMSQKVTFTNGAIELIVTMATEQVINISQYKATVVSYLIVGISAILRSTKLKSGMKMPLHPTVSSMPLHPTVSSISGC